jgi:hypothetical protein
VLPDNEVVIRVVPHEILPDQYIVQVYHRPTGVKHAVAFSGARREKDFINLALYELTKLVAKYKHRKAKRGGS